jgi:hypothetical protein
LIDKNKIRCQTKQANVTWVNWLVMGKRDKLRGYTFVGSVKNPENTDSFEFLGTQ